MRKIKVAMIGCGGMGNGHLDGYAGYLKDLFEVVALCDIKPEKAESSKARLGFDCKVVADYHEVLAMEDVEAVDIATPNYMHHVIAIDALNAGKHVFCEKPDCISVQNALDMKAASEKNGKTLMVMRNNRYYDGSVYLKNLIRKGEFGEIYAGRCGWQRRRGITGKGGWFTTKEQSGGGPLIDLGVHMIDLSIWLMGNPRPVAVSGCTFMKFADNKAGADSINATFGEAKADGIFDVEDLAMGFIRFDNGACLQIEFSWASNVKEEKRFVELRGTKAGCTWRDGTTVEVYSEDETGRLYDVSPKIVNVNGHWRNLEHFYHVIRDGVTPDFVPEQGVNMIKILNAMYESARTGAEVRL